ncbi:MAG: alkaline phosphatase family protein [Bacteroidales bacterium]
MVSRTSRRTARFGSLVGHASIASVIAVAIVAFRAGPAAQSASPIQTVFVIVFENYDWSQIKGNASAPYINSTVLPRASRAEQYYTPTGLHPSTPNYWWMEAGQDFGLRGLSDYTPAKYPLATSAHLVNQLEAAGISWKTYQENIDGATCPLTDQGEYTVHHNQFVFFTDVTNNGDPSAPRCLAHVRPYTELAADLAQNTVARYNYIVPNLCNDMHDCGIAAGDTWLANNLPAILNSPAYQNGGAVFIMWDEGANATSDGPIGMLVLSPSAKGSGYFNKTYYTHSSLLLTLQEIFNVRPLLGDAPNATDLGDLFTSFPAVTPSAPAPGDTASAVSTSVTLKWSSSGSSDDLYLGTANPPPLAATGIATHGFAASSLSATTTYYWQVVSKTSAGSIAGPVWSFTTGTSGTASALWANADVGAVGLAGSTTYGASSFTVQGAGADIWGTADGFQYVYQPIASDGQIVARVTGLQNTNTYAKAGVMIRESLAAGSPHVILDMKPGGGIEFMKRASASGTTSYLAGTTMAFPAWLRLQRTGNTIVGSVSSDGVAWTTVGSTTTSMAASALIGMPVTSHVTTTLTTATFDNAAVTMANSSSSPPSVPSLPSPADGATGVSTTPTLTWSANGATSYDVAFGSSNPPPAVATSLSVASYAPGTLAAGTTYFWQIVARNNGGTTTGAVWSFTTAPASPLPSAPSAPASPNPPDGATGVSANASLSWTSSGATSYDLSFGTSNPPPQLATGLTSASYSPGGLTAATSYYWQVVARNSTGTTSGPVWSFTTAGLPAPWLHQDIGTVGIAGSSTYANGVFTVKGAGSDIWGSTDSFQFVYQALPGDGTIVARVTSLQNTNTYAKAGLMMRQTLSPGSAHVILDLKPGGGVEFMTRSSTGGSTTYLAGASMAFPAWLRLQRSGATITGSVSVDGVSWSQVGSVNVTMTGSIYVGLPVCSHTTSQLTKATFDNVVIGP